jgi:mono/diheme cytochrome c family protein
MKKFLRITGYVLGVVVLLVASFAAYVALSGVPTYDPPVIPNTRVEVTPARVARGEVIAQVQCMGCHADKQNRLAGQQMIDIPEMFGTVYTQNITQDKEKGIGNWTDGELIYFLRTGVRRNGSYAPVMPQYPNLSDEDMHSVVAWLRSDRFPVQPVSEEPPASEFSFFTKFLTHAVMKPLPYPQSFIAGPDTTDLIALGKYTADAFGDCYGCHSADFVKLDKINTPLSEGYYGGGNVFKNELGETVLSSNLTFDTETGIGGRYTKEQFIRAVKTGVRPDGSILKYPMLPKSVLSDHEVGAIYEYLKTVPKIKNDIAQKTSALRMASK